MDYTEAELEARIFPSVDIDPMDFMTDEELDEQFEKFRNRPIGEICYLVVDATYVKVRHNGSVMSMAILWPCSLPL